MGTFTPTHGTATQFTVATITVNCVVTSVTRPSNPNSGLTYTLWGTALNFDYSQDWTQTPACGHAMTDSFTWTGTNAYVVQDTINPGRVNVATTNIASVGTHTVSV